MTAVDVESTLLPPKQVAYLFPILVSMFAAQGALLFGYNIGFSSPTGDYCLHHIVSPFLEQRGSTAEPAFLKDLAFAFLNLGAVPGALAASKIADAIGRRKALLWSALPFVVGILLLGINITSYALLCLGRFVCGVGAGSVSVLVPLYITEIAPPALRGSLGVFNQLFITLGILVVNFIGYFMQSESSIISAASYRFLCLLMLAPVALLLIAVSIGPETPRWYLAQNRREEAFHSLMALRQTSLALVEQELDDIVNNSTSIVGLPVNPENEEDAEAAASTSCGDLFSGSARLPFFLGMCLMIIQQWSGINGLLFNLGEVLGASGSLIFSAVQFGVTLLASFIMEGAGRRVFLISSTLIMGLSILIFGILLQYDPVAVASSTIPTVLGVIYVSGFSMGTGPIPWLICGELFPSKVRSLAVSWATVLNWGMGFIVTLTFSAAKIALGLDGLFYIYATVCFGGALFVFLFVPETRGKTLEEVEAYFAKHN